MAVAGCGSSGGPRGDAAEVGLQRRQFVLVSEGLRAAIPSVQRQLRYAHAVWPGVARGLPASVGTPLRFRLAQAQHGAEELLEPTFMSSAKRLAGPAASAAGLYETFKRLSERAWELLGRSAATIAGGKPIDAAFARQNAPLYIDAVYDGHFQLSLLGKSIVNGYSTLGGPRAFGSRLTPARVQALARAYSQQAARLEPHPKTGSE